MQIYCRQCGTAIKSENINLNNMMAKCSECDAVFSFADMYEDISPKKEKRELMDVPMPPGIRIDDRGGRLLIQRRWFTPMIIFVAFFAVLWNGMIWGVFVPTFSDMPGPGFFGLIGPPFLLPFIVIGAGLAVYAVSTLLNTTTIEVDIQAVKISHHPIPFPGKYIPAGDIEQLYTKQSVHRGENGTSYTYGLYIVTADGKREKLFASLSDADQALFIEQEIERFLGIEDRAIKGEFKRN